MAQAGDGVAGDGAASDNHPMRWAATTSGFMLRKLVELISARVKIDKGFKKVHLNQVAKLLNENFGMYITGTQVYNYLCKWHQRWVKISKLIWDDTNYVISLEEEHYMGHVKMATIFGAGQATGKYAMVSNESLGTPSNCGESSCLNGPAVQVPNFTPEASARYESSQVPWAPIHGPMQGPSADASTSSGKRKRSLNDEDYGVMMAMAESVRDIAVAMHATVPEPPVDVYDLVMKLIGFEEDDPLEALSHLQEHKEKVKSFAKMTEARRTRWVISFLAKRRG